MNWKLYFEESFMQILRRGTLFSHSCWRAYSCLSNHYTGNKLVLNVFPYVWAIDNLLESVRNPNVPEGGKRRHWVPWSLLIPAWACSRHRKQNEHRGTVESEGKNAAGVSPPDKAPLQLHILLLLLSASAQVALCSAPTWATQVPVARQRGHCRGPWVALSGA